MVCWQKKLLQLEHEVVLRDLLQAKLDIQMHLK
jgi:hypothetical protein